MKGSETEKNIIKAFIGESQARNRYSFFASQAKKDGFIKISKFFENISNQEKEHAKKLIELLNEKTDDLNITISLTPLAASTLENLEEALCGEAFEFEKMYPEFELKAKNENHPKAANLFKCLINAEKNHSIQLKFFIEEIKNNSVFKKQEKTTWQCINCGYTHDDKSAPKICPLCSHGIEYFEEGKK